MARRVIQRRTYLKRSGKPLRRGKRPKAKGGSRFPKRRDPAYLEWVRTWPCAIWAMNTPQSWQPGWRCTQARSEAAHVISRGAGGEDFGNAVPLCHAHHQEQHAIGMATFQRKYGVFLKGYAEVLASRYIADGGPAPEAQP